MKKNLILVTSSFPFSIKEASFIRPELEALYELFDITVISRNSNDEQQTDLPDDVKVFRYNQNEKYNPVKLGIKAVFCKDLYREICLLIKTKRLNKRNLKSLVRFVTRAEHFRAFAEKIRAEIESDVLLYTYWNDYTVYSLAGIKRKGDRLVSRVHRIELYEREENGNYLPLKKISNEKTDLVLAVCQEGKEYFEKHYNIDIPVKVSRLGVAEQAKKMFNYDKPYLSVFSLSYISPVKRVEEIIKTFALIDDINIHWTHIGSGTEEKKVVALAEKLLKDKPNIQYHFTGALENKKALEYVSHSDFDLLINVSSSEGLPVTMMEAMSFSIPVIATNVGGVSEIVCDSENGFLIESNENLNENLRHVIVHYNSLSVEDKKQLSENAYDTWRNNFDCKANNFKLAQMLYNL